MININIYLRFALMAGLTIVGIILTVWLGFWYAFPLFLAAIVLAIGYFLLGTIQSAGELMQAQQIDEAEQRLNLTRYPNLLYPSNKAYYYMLKANIALSKNNTKEAEEYLKIANDIEMPTSNETAVVQLQLANIAAKKGNWQEVNQRVQKMKKLTVTEPMISEQIVQLEKAYKNRGNIRMAQRMGMGQQQRGGKRRRPRMR